MTSEVRLLLGDCLELMRDLPAGSVDAVVTDPPYGAKRPSAWRLAEERFDEITGNDGVYGEWLGEASRVLRDTGALYVFACWQTMEQWRQMIDGVGLRVRSVIIWDKVVHGLADLKTCYAPQYEMIVFASKGRHELALPRPQDVIRRQRLSPTDMKHPYQKPVNVILPLLGASTMADDTVLDPFMGSGTTGVACVQTGRNFIGMEIDPAYFAIAERRIREAQMQPRLPMETEQKAEQPSLLDSAND